MQVCMNMEDHRIHVDIDLFKGDYCPRLSPDLLQVRDSQTQTDNETTDDEASINSVATTLLKSKESNTEDESLTEDERSPVIPPTPVKSLEKTKIVNNKKQNSHRVTPLSITITECLENLSKVQVISSSPVHSISSKDSTHSIEISPTKRKRQKYKRNQTDEVILSSSAHTSSNYSTPPRENHPVASKSEIIKINDSDDEPSSQKDTKIKQTPSRRPKKDKNFHKLPIDGKKRIVMNKVVYASSLPTSSEDSSDSDRSANIKQRAKFTSLSGKIASRKSNKRMAPSNSKKK